MRDWKQTSLQNGSSFLCGCWIRNAFDCFFPRFWMHGFGEQSCLTTYQPNMRYCTGGCWEQCTRKGTVLPFFYPSQGMRCLWYATARCSCGPRQIHIISWCSRKAWAFNILNTKLIDSTSSNSWLTYKLLTIIALILSSFKWTSFKYFIFVYLDFPPFTIIFFTPERYNLLPRIFCSTPFM